MEIKKEIIIKQVNRDIDASHVAQKQAFKQKGTDYKSCQTTFAHIRTLLPIY